MIYITVRYTVNDETDLKELEKNIKKQQIEKSKPQFVGAFIITEKDCKSIEPEEK